MENDPRWTPHTPLKWKIIFLFFEPSLMKSFWWLPGDWLRLSDLLTGTCYKDSHNRILPHGFYSSLSMSMDSCKSNCLSKGYDYAGVQFGKECWCGNDLPGNHLKRPYSECNMPCLGDRSQTCGQGWRMNVMRIGKCTIIHTSLDFNYIKPYLNFFNFDFNY